MPRSRSRLWATRPASRCRLWATRPLAGTKKAHSSSVAGTKRACMHSAVPPSLRLPTGPRATRLPCNGSARRSLPAEEHALQPLAACGALPGSVRGSEVMFGPMSPTGSHCPRSLGGSHTRPYSSSSKPVRAMVTRGWDLVNARLQCSLPRCADEHPGASSRSTATRTSSAVR